MIGRFAGYRKEDLNITFTQLLTLPQMGIRHPISNTATACQGLVLIFDLQTVKLTLEIKELGSDLKGFPLLI